MSDFPIRHCRHHFLLTFALYKTGYAILYVHDTNKKHCPCESAVMLTIAAVLTSYYFNFSRYPFVGCHHIGSMVGEEQHGIWHPGAWVGVPALSLCSGTLDT